MTATYLINLLCLVFLEGMDFTWSEVHKLCVGEDFTGQCPTNEVILINHALYGRMHIGKCVEEDFGQLGCQNEVLHLADRWCSGLSECTVEVPNDELKMVNTACSKDLSSYMEIQYSCLPVFKPPRHKCSQRVTGNQGYISSHVTTETGCGTSNSPLRLEARPGQTINLVLLDFGALDRQSSGIYSSCLETYGFIIERSLGVNHTLCGSSERKSLVYTSKTNNVEVQIITRPEQGRTRFLIETEFVGCSDLTPPAEAWYKREGSEAVIGCKSNDRVWRLHCHGNTWDGVVGNCSTKGAAGPKGPGLDFSFSSVIFLTGVVCAAFLLVIVVVVAGSVYIKKQSIKHEIKLRSEYSAATLSPSQYYTVKSGCDITTLHPTTTAQTPHLTADSQPLVALTDTTLPVHLVSQGHGTIPDPRLGGQR